MRNKEETRKFELRDGTLIYIYFNSVITEWTVRILPPGGETPVPERYELGRRKEWVDYSKTSPLKAFKKCRHKMRLDTDPKFKEVYERINPPGIGILETLRSAARKMGMSLDTNKPTKFYMHPETAKAFQVQLDLMDQSVKIADYQPGIIITDGLIPEEKIVRVEDEKI